MISFYQRRQLTLPDTTNASLRLKEDILEEEKI